MRTRTITQSLFLSLFFNGLGLNMAFYTSHWVGKHTRNAVRLHDSMVEDNNTDLEEEIRAMRTKDIKSELNDLGVSTVGLFEKEDLVQCLVARRQDTVSTPSLNAESSSDTNPGLLSDAISAPLYFTTFDKELRIASVNQDSGITVNPGEKPYATIKVDVEEQGASFTLHLLLDTACSGLVLRPSVVQKWNLPKLSTPVTMTGAGGSTVAQGLTQLSFTVGGKKFGPLQAVAQDIGALPGSLDGIIGLSFLKEFKCVDFDFVKGELRLYGQNEPPSSGIVSKGSMSVVPQLGLYATDVYFGGRGPVKMLVDSGASNTFLNWNGIDRLGIPRDDASFLERLASPMGAMGSDNNVAALTHRINVSSFLRLGSEGNGLSLQNGKRLSIDIGDIAILSTLEPYGICGILGVDAFMRCSCVRLYLSPRTGEIVFLE